MTRIMMELEGLKFGNTVSLCARHCLVHGKTLIMLLLSVIFHILLRGQVIILGLQKGVDSEINHE